MEAPKLYGEVVDPWDQNPLGARQLVVNDVQKVRVSPAELLTAHKLWPRWIWRWTTRIMPLEGSKASPLEFDRSQFAGAVLSGGQLRKIAADYIPRLSDGRLELMEGRASLEGIARKVAAEFPKRFSSWQEALSYAGVVSQGYSR